MRAGGSFGACPECVGSNVLKILSFFRSVKTGAEPPEPGPAQNLPPARLIWRVIRDNIGRQKWLYGVAICSMVAVALTTAATAWIMEAIFDVLSGAEGAHEPLVVSSVVLVIFALKGLAGYVQQVSLSHAGNRVVSRIQNKVYSKLLLQDAEWFDANETSSLLVLVTSGAQSARMVIDIVVTSITRDALTLIGLVTVMVWQNALLSVVFIFILPAALMGVRYVLAQVRKIAAAELASMTEVNKLVGETSTGLRVIRTFGLERVLEARMGKAVRDIERRNNAIVRLESITVPMMDILAGAAIGAVILFNTLGDKIETPATAGEVMSFITALLMAYEPAKRLSRVRVSLEAAFAGVRMMFSVLDRPDAIVDTPGAADLAVGPGAVDLRNVSFGYGARQVLSDLTLSFPAGKVTAIVGPSGGGKSTIMSLLLRLYDPQEGSVEIDGTDLRSVTRASMRANMSYAGQNTFLFSASVRDNIRMGRENATNEEVEDAARKAQAHDFIMELPQGYDTQVGENGAFLSGGQRQRLSLARAVLKDAPILLLDEATSALDNHSERLVRDAIAATTAGRTTIVIAHRLSTVMVADEVVYIEGGRLVEQGPLDRLLAGDSRFAALFQTEIEGAKEGVATL